MDCSIKIFEQMDMKCTGNEMMGTLNRQRLYALSESINEEFVCLHTQEERIKFIENIRFLMVSDNLDLKNYYFKQNLRDEEFYSIVNLLYRLNNLWMLSEFLKKHQQIIYYDVEKLINLNGQIEISLTGKLDRDTIVTRIFKMIKTNSEERRNNG